MLWAAIRATQKRWPKAKCVVYTGDHDVNKEAILARVEARLLGKRCEKLALTLSSHRTGSTSIFTPQR